MLGVFQLWGSQEPPLSWLGIAFQESQCHCRWSQYEAQELGQPGLGPQCLPPRNWLHSLPRVPLGLGLAQAPERRSPEFQDPGYPASRSAPSLSG